MVQDTEKSRERDVRAASPVCDDDGMHPERVANARSGVPAGDDVQVASELLKAVADPTRIRILSALSTGELCVCDLQAVLGMNQSPVSHQLRTLRSAHLVTHRREGKQVYYSLADHHVHELLQMTLEHVRHD